MRLTTYTDYSLRVLIYLASLERDEKSSIQEIADVYNISKNHLMKVTYNLGKMGYIETIRGRNGGMRLAKDPATINIGELVRKTEEDFYVVECFQEDHSNCVIAPVCTLKHVLNTAIEQFLIYLDQFSLADVMQQDFLFRQYFQAKLKGE